MCLYKYLNHTRRHADELLEIVTLEMQEEAYHWLLERWPHALQPSLEIPPEQIVFGKEL